MTHRHAFRVYYEDTDAGGVVYHARYLAFAERARTEALRDMAVPHQAMLDETGLLFMVRGVEMDYQAPARLDDELVVDTDVIEVGAASCRLRQGFLVAGRAIGVLHVRLACVRPVDGRPSRIPARWHAALTRELGGGSSG
jgi:acyl-CoA thioester hydrolase